MALSLKGLNEAEIKELEESLIRHKRTKIDYTNMTDDERAWKNRTVEPATDSRAPRDQYDPGWYPRVIYGMVNGQVVGATVADAEAEAKIWAKYPDGEWDKSLLEHGVETCPSKPSGHVEAGFQHFGAGKPKE